MSTEPPAKLADDRMGTAERGPPTVLSADLLVGAQAIAEFMYGPGANRRRVYALMEKKTNRPPIFCVGATMHARRSSIVAWCEELERRASGQP